MGENNLRRKRTTKVKNKKLKRKEKRKLATEASQNSLLVFHGRSFPPPEFIREDIDDISFYEIRNDLMIRK